MSGLFKAVKKVFKKIVKSPIFKAIAIAAVIWFTAGTAAAYFAAPQAGIGAAMSSSASSMWATTTSFFGAEAATAGATQSATTMQAVAEGGAAVAEGGATVAEASQAAWGTQAAAEGGAAIADASVLAESATMNMAAPAAAAESAAASYTPALSGSQALTGSMEAAAATAGAPVAAKTGMMAWLEANPMATMMLGQGVMGAASGYSADKEASRRSEIEADQRENRGLMGYDHRGDYGGVVNSQQQPTVAQAVAEPDASTVAPVQGQQVAAPTVAPQAPAQTAVPKDQLPKLLETGQLA